mgnify:CR=1 FL=1
MPCLKSLLRDKATRENSPGDAKKYQDMITAIMASEDLKVDRSRTNEELRVDKIVKDMSPFEKKYDPNHPAADAQGYVSLPNVNTLVEMMDMKEAQRVYDANLNMLKTAREMNSSVLDILK